MKRGFLIVAGSLLLVVFPATSQAVLQSMTPSALQPVTPFAGTADLPLITALQVIINVFLALVAIAAAIFIVIGGVRYITSSGDDSAAEKGKATVLYAVIGLIVIGLSAAIVNFTLGAIAVA